MYVAFEKNMLTQYDELKAARGRSSLGAGDENSMNFNSYDDSYYGGLSPAQARRSNSYLGVGEFEQANSALKRKKHSKGQDEMDDNRMMGSGLLDIPDELIQASPQRLSLMSDGKYIYIYRYRYIDI